MTKNPTFFSIDTFNLNTFKICKPPENWRRDHHLQLTRHVSTLSLQKVQLMIFYKHSTTSNFFPFLYLYDSEAIINLKIWLINIFYDSFEFMTCSFFSSAAIILNWSIKPLSMSTILLHIVSIFTMTYINR